MTKQHTIALAFLLSVLAFPCGAAITVTPAAPTANDIITIGLENRFGAEAGVASASIQRSGNTFTIQQNVDIACNLATNPAVASSFQVGPLAPGNYTISVTIVLTAVGPAPCSFPPRQETATFTVGPGVPIPALDRSALVFLGLALAVTALVILRA